MSETSSKHFQVSSSLSGVFSRTEQHRVLGAFAFSAGYSHILAAPDSTPCQPARTFQLLDSIVQACVWDHSIQPYPWHSLVQPGTFQLSATAPSEQPRPPPQ